MRERRIGTQVLFGENAQVADAFVELIATVHLDEEAAQALGTDLRNQRLGIRSLPGDVDRALARIRAEHLQGGVHPLCRHVLQHGDHDGIHLFPGGAACAPHPHGTLWRTILEEGGKNACAEGVPEAGIAKEPSDPDQDIFLQVSQFILPHLQEAHVVGQRLHA